MGYALSAGASLLGGLFGDDDPEQMPTSISGFETLPEPVKRAFLEQYLPGVLAQYNNGPSPGPLARARTGRYDSQGMRELQNYADNQARLMNTPQMQAMRQAQSANQAQGMNAGGFTNDPTVDRDREIQLRQLYQSTLKPGYKGPFTGDVTHNFGDKTYDPFMANSFFNPNEPNEYQKFRNAIIGGNSGGGMQNAGMSFDAMGNPVMGGGMGAGGSGGNYFSDSTGVRPLPGIEPFNPMQERAFDERQTFQPKSVESYVNPYSQSGLQGLQGMAAYDPMNRSIESYMKPYYDNIIQKGFSRIGEQLRGERRDILGKYARMGGIMGPENSTFNDQIALREAEALKNAQYFQAEQDIANFNQAQNQRNMEINRRAGFLGNLIGGGNDTYKIAGGLQAVGNDQRMQGLDALLAAGNQVQAHGQNENNAVNPLIQQQLPQNRLDMLGSRLGNFQGTNQSFTYGPGEQNMFSKVGNFGIGLAGLHQGYHNMRGTPWLGAAEKSGIGGLSGGKIGSIGGYV